MVFESTFKVPLSYNSSEWESWDPWRDCSGSCGSSTNVRIRTCPVPGKCFGIFEEYMTGK